MPALSSEDRWGSPITAALANSGFTDGCPSLRSLYEPRESLRIRQTSPRGRRERPGRCGSGCHHADGLDAHGGDAGGSLAARCAQTRAESYRRLARGPRRPSLASRGRLAELLAWGKRQEKIVIALHAPRGGSWITIPPRRRGRSTAGDGSRREPGLDHEKAAAEAQPPQSHACALASKGTMSRRRHRQRMSAAPAAGVPVWRLALYSKRRASSESGVRTTRDNAIMGLLGRRGTPSWTR